MKDRDAILPSYERMLLMLEDRLLISNLAFVLHLKRENYSIRKQKKRKSKNRNVQRTKNILDIKTNQSEWNYEVDQVIL